MPERNINVVILRNSALDVGPSILSYDIISEYVLHFPTVALLVLGPSIGQLHLAKLSWTLKSLGGILRYKIDR